MRIVNFDNIDSSFQGSLRSFDKSLHNTFNPFLCELLRLRVDVVVWYSRWGLYIIRLASILICSRNSRVYPRCNSRSFPPSMSKLDTNLNAL